MVMVTKKQKYNHSTINYKLQLIVPRHITLGLFFLRDNEMFT